WKVPHFEKMLCDQALLAMAYTEAFMITGKPLYRSTAEDILNFVLRDMKSPDGGFYSALYADEDYYLFSIKELRKILTPGELELVGDLYGVRPEGNFKPETGSNTRKLNIIYMNSTLHALAARLNTSENFLRAMDKTIRSKMNNYQRQRKRPFADNKVLTGWNSLMIVALLKAANAFSNEEFKHAALENASLLLNKMFMPDGSLCRALINGQPQEHGVLKDYAYTIWALLELYNSTFDGKYLARAESLTDYTERFFGDSENGGYFDSSTESESLIIRPRNVFDDAIPSGGTTMMLNLLKLGTLTGNLKYIALAEKDGNSMAAEATQSPENTSMIMNSLMYAQSPPWQVVIVGRRGQSDTEDILQAFKRSFTPFTSVRYFEADRSGLAADGVHRMQNAACTVYVYRNKVRLPPMHDLTQISKILNLKHK
ncbi:MAG: thioredoxin domain-containing protein, partial [Victivallales bacterium]|nr:thioredoxin domain-containing protein [Victivallales bacterium]